MGIFIAAVACVAGTYILKRKGVIILEFVEDFSDELEN